MDHLFYIYSSIFLMLWNLSYMWWVEEVRGRVSDKITLSLNVLSFGLLFMGMMKDDATVGEMVISALKAGLVQFAFVLTGAIFIHIVVPTVNKKYRNKKPRPPTFSAVDL